MIMYRIRPQRATRYRCIQRVSAGFLVLCGLLSVRADAQPAVFRSSVSGVAGREQTISSPLPSGKKEGAWQERLGAPVLACLTRPDRIEAFRVRWDSRAGEQIIVGSRVTLSRALGERASRLLETRTHTGKTGIKCREALVLYRFWKGMQSVDVRVYFDCLGLCIVNTRGQTVEQSGFRAVYPEMVRLTKAAFPNDATVQALREIVPPVSENLQHTGK